jgi:anti-sigma28 factor (negative regulator of flagellin synthesis)
MDQTRFSFDQARVQSLEAEVMAQPEIREQKVGSLQKLLVTGRYKVSDAQVAHAMVAELAGGK